MKALTSFFNCFAQFDLTVNRWLVGHSSTLLRVCTGIVFLEFGLVKFFEGNSTIEDMATYMLTGGLLSGDMAADFVAIVECVTGLCFLSSRSVRLGIWLLAVQLVGASVPFVFFSNELLITLFYTPILAVQYIISEIILVAAGLFIAVNWSEARLTPEPEKVWLKA